METFKKLDIIGGNPPTRRLKTRRDALTNSTLEVRFSGRVSFSVQTWHSMGAFSKSIPSIVTQKTRSAPKFAISRVFLRRSRDPNRVPRISNRLSRIRENYHRVPKIRESRVPRIR